MSQPIASPTLRTLSGLPDTPANWAQAALVLVDCQNTYREGVMRLDGVEPALEEARKLLDRARALGRPVIHIQHDAGEGRPYDIRSPIGQIALPVAPQSGEAVVVKHYPNAFVGTDLEAKLRTTGVQQVVLAGFMTHMCINSTARGAFNLGFAPTVVSRATATRPLPLPGGGVMPAEQLQQASLASLADLFAVVVPSLP